MEISKMIAEARILVSKESGSLIRYRRTKDPMSPPIEIMALIHSPARGEAGSNRVSREYIADEIEFGGVKLEFMPQKDDKVEYLDTVWTVIEFHGNFNKQGGVGNLRCIANKVHTSRQAYTR